MVIYSDKGRWHKLVIMLLEVPIYVSILWFGSRVWVISVFTSRIHLPVTDNIWGYCFNSLAPVKFEWNFRYLIFQIISVIDGWVISCELARRLMSLDLTDDKSTLVQVMAWCHQPTSHYLSQCWPRSLSPYGVIRPQWVNWRLPGS